LESAGIKLAGVASDVFGVSGRAMLRELIEGEQSAAEMARLARGRMRRKQAELARALDGHVDEHHRLVLRLQLQRITAAEADLELHDARLREKLAPYDEAIGRLMQIPGVDWVIAGTIIAEIGIDMDVFHGAAHLASWTGLCPATTRAPATSAAARPGMAMCGSRPPWSRPRSAALASGTYLADRYRRLCARRGKMRAAVAIAHKILVAVYHTFAKRSDCRELGPS
jgi:hypothetical protein